MKKYDDTRFYDFVILFIPFAFTQNTNLTFQWRNSGGKSFFFTIFQAFHQQQRGSREKICYSHHFMLYLNLCCWAFYYFVIFFIRFTREKHEKLCSRREPKAILSPFKWLPISFLFKAWKCDDKYFSSSRFVLLCCCCRCAVSTFMFYLAKTRIITASLGNFFFLFKIHNMKALNFFRNFLFPLLPATILDGNLIGK